MFKLEITKDNETMSVTQPEPQAQETVLARLNRLAKECGYSDIHPHAIEALPWDGLTSTTVTFNRNQEDAYTLNPVVAARMRDYNREGVHRVPENYVGLVGVHRAMIGYSAVSRINSVADMKQTMYHIINMGKQDLINQFGYRIVAGYKITMEYPGQEGTFFRELENSAAYEIRLWLTKEV